MNKYFIRSLWICAFAFLLTSPVAAQPVTQILTTNLSCTSDARGPYIIIEASDGSVSNISIARAKTLVNSNVKNDKKTINTLKGAIKKKQNVSKNKKKLLRVQKDLLYWQSAIKALQDCSKIGAFVPTPTPTAVTGGSGGGGYEVIPPADYYLLTGALIYANDGTYLGIFSNNQYATDSIANQYGTHGSQYSRTSIFNRYSTYGSDYSHQSPWDQYSSIPPILYIGGVAQCYLTNNPYKSPRVDSAYVMAWANQNR